MFGFGSGGSANYGIGVLFNFRNMSRSATRTTKKDMLDLERQAKKTDMAAQGLFDGLRTGTKGLMIGGAFIAASIGIAAFGAKSQQVWKDLEAMGVEHLPKLRKEFGEFIRDSSKFGAKSNYRELLGAFTEFASAGITQADQMIAGLKRVDKVAIAGMGTVEQATDIFTDFHNLWNWMPGTIDEKTEKWAAAVTATQQVNKVWLPVLSTQMARASASAASQRVDYSEFTAMVGVLAGSGLRENAGTAAMAYYENIAKAQKVLGLKLIESSGPRKGMVRPILEVIGEIKSKYGEAIDAIETRKLAEAFDQRGAKAIKTLILMEQKMAETMRRTKQYGIDVDVADKRTESFGYQVGQLGNAFTGMGDNISEGPLPVLTGFVGVLAKTINLVSAGIQKFPMLGTLVVGIMGSVGTAIAGASTFVIGKWLKNTWRTMFAIMRDTTIWKTFWGGMRKGMMYAADAIIKFIGKRPIHAAGQFFKSVFARYIPQWFNWGKMAGLNFTKGLLLPLVFAKKLFWDLPKELFETRKKGSRLERIGAGGPSVFDRGWEGGDIRPTERGFWGTIGDWGGKASDFLFDPAKDAADFFGGMFGREKYSEQERNMMDRMRRKFPGASEEEYERSVLARRQGYYYEPSIPEGITGKPKEKVEYSGTVIQGDQKNEFIFRGDPEANAKAVAKQLGVEVDTLNIRKGRAVNKPAMAGAR